MCIKRCWLKDDNKFCSILIDHWITKSKNCSFHHLNQ